MVANAVELGIGCPPIRHEMVQVVHLPSRQAVVGWTRKCVSSPSETAYFSFWSRWSTFIYKKCA